MQRKHDIFSTQRNCYIVICDYKTRICVAKDNNMVIVWCKFGLSDNGGFAVIH